MKFLKIRSDNAPAISTTDTKGKYENPPRHAQTAGNLGPYVVTYYYCV